MVKWRNNGIIKSDLGNIGETGRRIADRFGEHLHSVEGYYQVHHRYQNNGYPVAEHFCKAGHNSIDA